MPPTTGTAIPCIPMRGDTSRGPHSLAADLPGKVMPKFAMVAEPARGQGIAAICIPARVCGGKAWQAAGAGLNWP